MQDLKMRHLKLFETNGYNQNIYKYKIEFLSKKKLQLCKSECGKDKAPKRDFNAQYFDNQISLFLYEKFSKFGIQ